MDRLGDPGALGGGLDELQDAAPVQWLVVTGRPPPEAQEEPLAAGVPGRPWRSYRSSPRSRVGGSGTSRSRDPLPWTRRNA